MPVAVLTAGASGFGLALGERCAALEVDAVLAGEPYVITHGDLVTAVERRAARLLRAAEAARDA